MRGSQSIASFISSQAGWVGKAGGGQGGPKIAVKKVADRSQTGGPGFCGVGSQLAAEAGWLGHF